MNAPAEPAAAVADPADPTGARGALSDLYEGEGLLLFDPPEVYDRAIAGVATRVGGLLAVAYWYDELVAALVASGMEREEAVEWVDVNTTGAWVGERTPIVLHRLGCSG